MKSYNLKPTLADIAKKLSKNASEGEKMEVGQGQPVLVTEQRAKAEKCKAMAKKKLNAGALRAPLKVSQD